MKIRGKILIAFFLMLCTAYIVYDLFLVESYKNEILKDLETNLRVYIEQSDYHLTRYAINLENDIDLIELVFSEDINKDNGILLEDYFNKFVKTKASTKYIFFGNESGTFIYNDKLAQENDLNGYDVRERPWYKKAIAYPNQVVITEPYKGIDGKTYFITFAKAITNINGEIIGVIGIDIDFGTVESYLRKAFKEERCEIGIVTDHIMVSSNGKSKLEWREEPNEYISFYNDISEYDKLGKFKIEEEEFYSISKLSDKLDWIFYVKLPLDYVSELQSTRVAPFWTLSAVLLFFMILILMIIIQKILIIPIIRMNRIVSDIIQTGDLDHKLNFERQDEIGQLADSFDSMLFKLLKNREELEYKVSERTAELTKLKVAVEQSPSGIVITDLEGNVMYTNKRVSELTGYREEELIGQKTNLFKTTYHDRAYYDELWETIESGKIWRGEFYNKKKDESCYWEKCLIAPVTDENGDIVNYIAMKEDVTELKAAQEELVRAKAKAEMATQAKSDFLANMSHEIRTPMNAIIGINELLMGSELSIRQKDYSEKIERAAKHLLKIINDVLDFSKIEAGKLVIENIEFDLKNVLDDLESIMGVEASKKDIDLIFDIDQSCPVNLIGDELRLNQILLNLIGNAIKFTDEGEVRLRVVCLKEEKDSVYFLFDLKDTGIGISEEEQDKIFQKFTQADESITRKYGGTGLGLVIVEELIGIMNGKLEIESEVGRGTRFKVFIEFKKNNLSSKPIKAKEKSYEEYGEARKTIDVAIDLEEIEKLHEKRKATMNSGENLKLKMDTLEKKLINCLENYDTDAEDYVIKLMELSKEDKEKYNKIYKLVLDYEFDRALEIMKENKDELEQR
ncbi:MAG: ATP-binding protein [Tissierellales bacterium]|jgi:PAS domain S-box-containing protein|nr:ATP-binding protein [Tissierellales bacterium]